MDVQVVDDSPTGQQPVDGTREVELVAGPAHGERVTIRTAGTSARRRLYVHVDGTPAVYFDAGTSRRDGAHLYVWDDLAEDRTSREILDLLSWRRGDFMRRE